MSNWFPKWQPYQGENENRPVATNEYLPPLQSAVLGVQHAFAMFGATVLAPLLMGFSPNLAILMSGICPILFFLITGGRVPSYLGSSFAFIGVVAVATGHITGSAANSDRQQAVQESSKKRLTRSSDQIKIPLLCRQRKRSANKFFKNQQPISVGV